MFNDFKLGARCHANTIYVFLFATHMAHWRDDQKGFWRLSTLSVECQYLSVFLTPESILEIAVSIAVASALVVLPHVLACQDKINIVF